MLKEGMQWLAEQRDAFLSRGVTYQRGVNSVGIRAMLARGEFQLVDEQTGLVRRVETRDFIVRREQLEKLGIFPPVPGDRMWVDGIFYEVNSVSGMPCWRTDDEHGVMVRVHALEVG